LSSGDDRSFFNPPTVGSFLREEGRQTPTEIMYSDHHRMQHQQQQPPCLVRGDRTPRLEYAVATVPCESNEDTNFAALNHFAGAAGGDVFASFGVFDGHSGGAAAHVCSSLLHDSVAGHLHELVSAYAQLAATDTDATFQEIRRRLEGTQVLNDALVCEAIRRACVECDRAIKRRSDAGTTAVSLFVLQDADGTR